MSLFTNELITDRIVLHPEQLHDNINATLTRVLRERYEGKCSSHEFIRSKSIKIHKIGVGVVQAISLNGDVSFQVEFYADVCSPSRGQVFQAKIRNMNKFGVLVEVLDDANANVVIEAIISRQVNAQGNGPTVDMDSLNIDDIVFLEVLKKKFELGDKKISVIGKLVQADQRNKCTPSTSTVKSNVKNVKFEKENQIHSDDNGSDSDEDDDDSSSNDSDNSSNSNDSDDSNDSGVDGEEDDHDLDDNGNVDGGDDDSIEGDSAEGEESSESSESESLDDDVDLDDSDIDEDDDADSISVSDT